MSLERVQFQEQFQIYLQNKLKTTPPIILGSDEEIKQEFISKSQFFIHKMKMDLDLSITMLDAAKIINTNDAISFSKDISGRKFDGFMHFIAANETKNGVLSLLMQSWVNEGRDLEEIDEQHPELMGYTPLKCAVRFNNFAFIESLESNGIDVTKPDATGLTALHGIILQIKARKSDQSILKKWVDAGFKTDVLATKEARKECAGKTPLDLAISLGVVEAVKILGGDVKLAQKNLDKLSNDEFNTIYTKIKKSVLKDKILKKDADKNISKVFLSYVVNHPDKVSLPLFNKILDKRNLVDVKNELGDSALSLMIKKGNIDHVVEIVKRGIGTEKLDNGNHVLTYIEKFGGNNQVALIKAVTPYVDFKSTKILDAKKDGGQITQANSAAQALANALVKKNTALVQELINSGVDINYNNGKILKLLLNAGAQHVDAIKIAIIKGAKITDEMQSRIQELDLVEEVNKAFEKKASNQELQEDVLEVLCEIGDQIKDLQEELKISGDVDNDDLD